MLRRSWNPGGITWEYACSKVLLRAPATPCHSNAFSKHLQLQQNLLSPLTQPCRVQGSPGTAKYISSAPSPPIQRKAGRASPHLSFPFTLSMALSYNPGDLGSQKFASSSMSEGRNELKSIQEIFKLLVRKESSKAD